jgi:hypothetical protein
LAGLFATTPALAIYLEGSQSWEMDLDLGLGSCPEDCFALGEGELAKVEPGYKIHLTARNDRTEDAGLVILMRGPQEPGMPIDERVLLNTSIAAGATFAGEVDVPADAQFLVLRSGAAEVEQELPIFKAMFESGPGPQEETVKDEPEDARVPMPLFAVALALVVAVVLRRL